MHRMRLFIAALTLATTTSVLPGGELAFQEQELSTKLTVGYAVRLIDMNAAERLDIVIVNSKRLLWLENPNWNEHKVRTVCPKTIDAIF